MNKQNNYLPTYKAAKALFENALNVFTINYIKLFAKFDVIAERIIFNTTLKVQLFFNIKKEYPLLQLLNC